jgi:hypothetical protein
MAFAGMNNLANPIAAMADVAFGALRRVCGVAR